MTRPKTTPPEDIPGLTSLYAFLNRPVVPWLAGLAILVLLMFGDVLFNWSPVILSQPGTDLTACDIPLKSYGFDQLRHGTMPFWNPYIWSGIPYFAGFDTGLLFPVNLAFLVLPFDKAMNLSIALETWLLGAGMFFLCRQRGMQPLAGFLSGTAMMFSGVYFLHIYSGHPNNTGAMAMAPYLYLAADLIGSGKRRQGWLVGSAALAFQLLACQAQYVFYTCIGVLIYSILILGTVRARVRFILTMAVMVLGAVCLAAVQLVPAHSYISESLRNSHGMPYEFAAMFSLAPENLLTMLAPDFFGDMSHVAYWGRCYMWEMTPFIGVTALILAVYGICRGRSWVRWTALPMIAITFVLALGAHTPLFRFLYDHVPGFNSLRGNSKFDFQTILFITLVAGAGLDAIIRDPQRLRLTAAILAGIALVLAAFGIGISVSAAGGTNSLWAQIPQAVWSTGETYLPPEKVHDPDFLRATGDFACKALLITAATVFLVAVILTALRKRPKFLAPALCALGIAEVFLFAHGLNPSFNVPDYFEKTGANGLKQFLSSHPGDYRILLLGEPNVAMTIGAQNIWGYGSTPLKRYIEFMGFTQGVNPDTANQYVQFQTLNRLYSMLRCKYAFIPKADGFQVIPMPEPMSRVSLITKAKVVTGRDNILAAMNDAFFEPTQSVILETPPDPAPVKSYDPGNAVVTRSGPDYLDIDANLNSPAILLVTDIYTAGWHAKALPGSSQSHYDVVPANYILRAIPLGAGVHHIRMEYSPPGFAAGLVLSLLALSLWMALAILQFRSVPAAANQ